MKKWAISAVIYLLVVTGGYYTYATVTGNELESSDHANGNKQHNLNSEHTEESGNEGHEEGHSKHGEAPVTGESDVIPQIEEESGNIVITLKDNNGDMVSELNVNHEKLMHFIVVSTDLKVYKHLHPVLEEDGIFTVENGLEDGEYKVFVDIKPKNLSYEVLPIDFLVGSPHNGHEHDPLLLDTQFVKEVREHKVTFKPSSLNVNEEIQLKFDLHGETPEQYLGALGHVVILDEKAENYIHVHPLDGDVPIFETKFTKPGIYKIWSEFQFNGEVIVFPYVVEIK